jgi:hypothetical protein
MTTYWLPTRPYSLIDAINRMAAATGSCRYAMLASDADYNGHHVSFTPPNDYKRYWTCHYTWAGIHTIGRGSLDQCLAAAEREYDRGAKAATAVVSVESPEDVATIEARGRWEPYSKEIEAAHFASFKDARFDLINEAVSYEKNGLFPGAVGVLANCESAEDYKAQYEAYHTKEVERRARERKLEAERQAEWEKKVAEERELDAQGRKLGIIETAWTVRKSCYLRDKVVRQVGQVLVDGVNGMTYRLLQNGSPDIDCESLVKLARKVTKRGYIETACWEMVEK